jgi:hypothetical protein
MSDVHNAGSGAPGNPPSGAPGGTGQQNGSSPVHSGANWVSGLQDEGNRTYAQQKGWDKAPTLEPVIVSYRELEGRLGKSVVPPGDNATKEDYDKFATAVGRPANPDGYAFKLPQGLPSDFPYDEVSATKFKNWSHKAGLAPWQSQSIHDDFVADAAASMANQGAQLRTRVQAAHSQIVNQWGSPDSAGYKRNVDMAGRAVRKLNLVGTFKGSGLMTASGEITDANLAFALAKVGEGLYAEDRNHGGPGNLTEKNPWKEGQENLTEQGRLVRSDPELAKTLIRAAGKDPDKILFDPKR